jgi:hypothetical protein
MDTLLSAYSSYVQAEQQAEEAAVSAKYDKEIKAAGKNSKKVEKLEKEKEEELAKVRAEYQEKSFAIQIAQALASTAMAAINAYSSAALIPVVGTVLAPIAAGVALTAGMLQVAAIKKQHEAAKAGYRSGGYTPAGQEDEEAGVVHKGEFVANAEAVKNPDVKKFLDVFNVAQKNGSIRMINTPQILEKVKLSGGYRSGGYVSDTAAAVAAPVPVVHIQSDPEIKTAVEKLLKRLDEPIEAYSVISGKSGSYERTREYERLMKNVHR